MKNKEACWFFRKRLKHLDSIIGTDKEKISKTVSGAGISWEKFEKAAIEKALVLLEKAILEGEK